MSELLKIVLSLSFSGTLMFLLILALKLFYKNRLNRQWQYYIWLIVVVRMLLPFTIDTTFVGSAFEYLGTINVEVIQTIHPVNEIATISTKTLFIKVFENIWILWASFAFALLIRKITLYQSFVRFVKAGWVEVSDIDVLNILADMGEMVRVKRPVELFVNPLISAPMLIGFFRPYIILPSMDMDHAELAYIMRHEMTHYKHLDMFYKWLVQIMVCIHWFNPFTYLLAKEINKCCELSCDEAIIRTLDKNEKKAYGDTLLNALKITRHYNEKLATVSLAESANQLKERLDAILNYKKASKIAVIIMFMLTLVLTMGATVIGAYALPTNQIPPWSAMRNNNEQPYTYLQELAEEYYINHESNKFYAIFSSLDEKTQKDYCTRMIDDEENAFLAGTAKFMEPDIINFCLDETYQQDKIALFAGIVPCLTNDQKQVWIARASRDDKNNFLAVLTR